MKKNSFTRGVYSRLGLMFLFLMCGLMGTDIPRALAAISYQGYIEQDGAPLNQSSVPVTFRIYTSETGTKVVWQEPQTMDVTGGIYHVMLGSSVPFVDGLFGNHAEYWLEVEVNGTALPRKQVGFAPMAYHAVDSERLNGNPPSYYAVRLHSHDADYVNTGEANSITSAMITDGQVTTNDVLNGAVSGVKLAGNAVDSSKILNNSILAEDIQDGAVLQDLLLEDGAGTGLDADMLDGMDSLAFVKKSGGSMTGILSVSTSAIPATVKGGHLTGAPTNGYLGAQGTTDFDAVTTADWNGWEIGVAGISTGTSITDNYGILGHSNNVGVRGEYSGAPTGSYGELGRSDSGVFGNGTYGVIGAGILNGVRGNGGDTGLFGQGTKGVYGFGSKYGVYGTTDASPLDPDSPGSHYHAGFFYSSLNSGLFSSTLYTRSNNTGGLALWAHNDSATSTDATIVSSNDGTGDLFKGFGSNGGNHEIAVKNDGSIELLNAGSLVNVRITPRDSSAGKISLHNANGIRTVDLLGSFHGNAAGGMISLYNSSGAATIQLDSNLLGNGRVITQELEITGGSDLSENFNVGPGEVDSVRPGMVVSIDPENPGALQVSRRAYDNKVAGIISGAGGVKPGMMMGQRGSVADGDLPVALTGRVYCYADASGASIVPGDLLTTSANPGHAMKVSDHQRANGAILGKAMTGLDSGTGLVLVLVSLQ